jgi:uncharacterized integral membrane protein
MVSLMEEVFENTDGRKIGDWHSRYEPGALRQIIFEAIYLAVLLFLTPVLILAAWAGWSKLGLTDNQYLTVSHYFCAWMAGTFGGTMFSIKWLYHAVARCYWNMDRRLWRIFCPHLSGGLAFAFLTIILSGLIRSIDVASLHR